MVNIIGHWFRIPFGTLFWIPLRGLSSFRGIGFWIPFRGLSGFWVAPGLVVPEHPIPVIFCRCFSFSMYFFGFQISWSHSSVMPNWVIFFDIICQFFLTFSQNMWKLILLSCHSFGLTTPIRRRLAWEDRGSHFLETLVSRFNELCSNSSYWYSIAPVDLLLLP